MMDPHGRMIDRRPEEDHPIPHGLGRKGLKCPIQGCEKRFNGPEMTGLASHYRAAHEGQGEPRYE